MFVFQKLYDLFFGLDDPLISMVYYDQFDVSIQNISINHNGQVTINDQIFPPNENIVKIANTQIATYNVYDFSNEYGDSISRQAYTIITINTDRGKKEIKAAHSMPNTLVKFINVIESLAKSAGKL